MDACWSYAYYTKQVFRHKATATDPTGWDLVDVVNNTEMGNTGSEGVTSCPVRQHLQGRAAVNNKQSATRYPEQPDRVHERELGHARSQTRPVRQNGDLRRKRRAHEQVQAFELTPLLHSNSVPPKPRLLSPPSRRGTG